jgi:hypothetical protein
LGMSVPGLATAAHPERSAVTRTQTTDAHSISPRFHWRLSAELFEERWGKKIAHVRSAIVDHGPGYAISSIQTAHNCNTLPGDSGPARSVDDDHRSAAGERRIPFGRGHSDLATIGTRHWKEWTGRKQSVAPRECCAAFCDAAKSANPKANWQLHLGNWISIARGQDEPVNIGCWAVEC